MFFLDYKYKLCKLLKYMKLIITIPFISTMHDDEGDFFLSIYSNQWIEKTVHFIMQQQTSTFNTILS